MAKLTRRNFLKTAALAGAAGMLAGCNNGGTEGGAEPTPEPEPSGTGEATYPIEPEEFGSGEVKYTVEDLRSFSRIANDGGPVIGVADKAKLIQVDGYCFKDLNGNGKLDLWEDWRQDPEARAEALAAEMDFDLIPGLMLFEGSLSNMVSGSLPDEAKALLDKGVLGIGAASISAEAAGNVAFNNAIQTYAEGINLGIPADFCSDPRNSGWGIGVSPFPENLALAATFDPAKADEAYRKLAPENRALGVTTLLGPQTDVAVEPRWGRNTAAFGADPALSRDMLKAAANALQSTWSESGEDLGWGVDSVNGMMKHFPGDGAAQGGREAHDSTGQFNVYPGGMFEMGLVPFIDGGLALEGKTGRCAAAMTSYSVAWSEDEEYGELVGTSFSDYKLGILRNDYAFDGVICTDWQVIEDDGMPWGVENLTPEERVAKALKAGVDQFGGGSVHDIVADGIKLYASQVGEDAAQAQIRNTARRLLLNRFRIGLFENPFINLDEALATVMNEQSTAEGYAMQEKTVVMLKNDGVIAKSTGDAKPKVYVPLVYSPGVMGFVHQNVSSADLPVDEELLREYFDLVTDTVGEATGDPDDTGNPNLLYTDIVRATPEQLADCDYALVFARTTQNTTFWSITGGVNMFTQEYVPLSMQYAPYVADGPNVPQTSLAGRLMEDGSRENMSYYGKEALVDNGTDLDMIKYAQQNMPAGKPTIVCINAEGKSPIAGQCVGEFEADSAALLYGFNINNRAFLNIVTGKTEPSALLPIQLPKDMDAVEAQLEDVPRDMDCYVDAAGNVYDFGFGLNWQGVISDERTAKYCVAPLTAPETPKVS